MVLFGSTKTSLPTAMPLILVEGKKWEMLD